MQKSLEFYVFFTNRPLKGTLRGCTEVTSELCSKFSSQFRKWLSCAACHTKSHGKWPLTGPGLGNLQYVHWCPCTSVHGRRVSVSWCVVWLL